MDFSGVGIWYTPVLRQYDADSIYIGTTLVRSHYIGTLEVSVKMETLCSRFYAVIAGTSGDINVTSSGECLESKN